MADTYRPSSALEMLLATGAPANVLGLGHEYFTQGLQQTGQPIQGGFVVLPGTQGDAPTAMPDRSDALMRFLQDIIGGPREAY